MFVPFQTPLLKKFWFNALSLTARHLINHLKGIWWGVLTPAALTHLLHRWPRRCERCVWTQRHGWMQKDRKQLSTEAKRNENRQFLLCTGKEVEDLFQVCVRRPLSYPSSIRLRREIDKACIRALAEWPQERTQVIKSCWWASEYTSSKEGWILQGFPAGVWGSWKIEGGYAWIGLQQKA